MFPGNNYIKNTALVSVALIFFTIPFNGLAQTVTADNLFESDSILHITLKVDMHSLFSDRGDNPKYHPLIISYFNDANMAFDIRAEAKTRGHFRKLRQNCYYPPLLLHFFKNDTLQSSIFKDQGKLKLVMPCSSDDYIIYEYLVYKLYNIVTPKSFRARLVSITIEDNNRKKVVSPFYGILLEDEYAMAKRNNDVIINKKTDPKNLQQFDFLKMAVFEYMVGNTDWSVQYLQNIKLLANDSTAIPTAVPYDFDHAGIVGAPYAKPAEELEMSSVKERRYRGYCMNDMKEFDSVVVLFNNAKPDIYHLYAGSALVDTKYLKTTIKYLDDFYNIINNPVSLKKEFGYPCDKSGTGNVIIKGLRD